MTQDDWRAETQTRLVQSALYNNLAEKCKADAAGRQALQLTDDATHYAYQRTKTILVDMGEYTLHDGDHLFRVLLLMERLIPSDQLNKLSIPELMLLILSAFFHDIGMAPSQEEVESWKKIWDKTPSYTSELDEENSGKFRRYVTARDDQKKLLEKYIKQGENSSADLLKGYLISEYIRTTHAQRAREIIKADWEGKIYYRDSDLTVELASICYSHNEDPLAILNLDSNYLCGPSVYANMQFIAIVLRLADILDFDSKRTPSLLFSHLFVKNPISVAEWQKHRSIEAWAITSADIQFNAKCNHPAIEASIHQFCDLIDRELIACSNLLTSMNQSNRQYPDKVQMEIPVKVDRSRIETKKDIEGNPIYLYRETRFDLSKNQVIELLMGTKLYGDPEVALRELLQNSIDACLLRKAQEAAWGTNYDPTIEVKYYKEGDEYVLEVEDNGTGMDQHIIDTYYSKIGSSFYRSTDFFDIQSLTNARFTPTSRFGIGILSCFMVADVLSVDTRKVYGPHDSSDPINLRIEGQDSIFWIRPGIRKVPGTSTKLHLRSTDDPWNQMDDDAFIKSVETVIPNPPFDILIKTNTKQTKKKVNSIIDEVTSISLRESHWDHDSENIREISLTFHDKAVGFVGSAIVAILQSNGMPTSSVEMTSNTVDIDGQEYVLERSLSQRSGDIKESSTSITIDEEGSIDQSDTYHSVYESRSIISLHGIEVPHPLFPHPWRAQKNQVRLNWPFSVLLVVDVCGDMDLDLNSSRTQIIMSDRWLEFERILVSNICAGICNEVGSEYWCALQDVISKNSTNVQFLQGMNSVSVD